MSQSPPQNDTSIQRNREKALVEALAAKLQVPLAPGTLTLEGCQVHIDGFAVNEANKNTIIVEAHAPTEKVKLGSQRKIFADILKLVYVRECLQEKFPGYKIQMYLAFCTKQAAEEFRGTLWEASALVKFGIQVFVHSLPAEKLSLPVENQPRLESAAAGV